MDGKVIKSENAKLQCDCKHITGNNNEICGKFNTILGDKNQIIGNYNTVKGDENIITGGGCSITGEKNTIKGHENKIYGDTNTAIGQFNVLYATTQRKQPNKKIVPIIGSVTTSKNENSKPENSSSFTFIYSHGTNNNIIAGNGNITISSEEKNSDLEYNPNAFSLKRKLTTNNNSRETRKKRRIEDDNELMTLKCESEKDRIIKKIEKYLDKDETSNDEPNECISCMTNQRKVVWMPCSHINTCFSCAMNIAKSEKGCPVCRQKITDVVIPFF